MTKDAKYIFDDWENEILSVTKDAIECAVASAYFSPYGIQFLEKLSIKLANYVDNKERKGDYYIVDVIVTGKKKQLFYSQSHMAKITGFLEQTEDQAPNYNSE